MALLNLQPDYILFMSAFAFLALGVISLLLKQRAFSRLPWQWLELFAVLSGLSCLNTLVAQGVGQTSLFPAINLMLGLTSYLALLEFARHGHQVIGVRIPGRGILIVPLAGAALGVLAGMEGFQGSILPVLGLTGCLGSALLFIRVARLNETTRWRLFMSAAAMAGLGFVLLLDSASYPGWFLSPLSAHRHASEPTLLVLLQAFLVALITVGLWQSHQASSTSPRPIRNYSVAFCFTTILVALLAAGYLATGEAGKRAAQEQRTVLSDKTRLAATTFDPLQIQTLLGDERDLKNPGYQQIKVQLASIRKALPECRFVYLLKEHDGKVIFLADSEPPGTENYSPPGQVYTEASPELFSFFTTGTPFLEGPITDRWGVWFSGTAPIVAPQSGAVLAGLGMDVSAAEWNRTVETHRLTVIALTFLVSMLLLMFFYHQQRSNEALERIIASERGYRELFSEMLGGFMLLEPVPGADGAPADLRFLDLNPAAEQLIHLSRNEAVGKCLAELFSPVDPFWLEVCGEVTTTGLPLKIERYSNGVPPLSRPEYLYPGTGEAGHSVPRHH